MTVSCNTVFKMAAALALAAGVGAASAHDGRRFEIRIVDGQLIAQGYISSGVDDGGGVERPYINTIHGHWANAGEGFATASLPGFDLPAGQVGDLAGHTLTLTVTGGRKWDNPPAMPAPGTVVDLQPLDPADELFISYFESGAGFTTVSTTAPGSIELISSVSPSGLLDIDFSYEIEANPSAELYVIDAVLSTDAPGVAASEPIAIILSPDGANPMEKLHHAALYLETQVGIYPPCNAADLAAPFGTLNFADVQSFLGAFGAGLASADVAAPAGVFNFADVQAFLGLFGVGCE